MKTDLPAFRLRRLGRRSNVAFTITEVIYSPPNRQWTFDLNFMDSTKLPPGTPEVRALIRAEWGAVAAGNVN